MAVALLALAGVGAYGLLVWIQTVQDRWLFEQAVWAIANEDARSQFQKDAHRTPVLWRDGLAQRHMDKLVWARAEALRENDYRVDRRGKGEWKVWVDEGQAGFTAVLVTREGPELRTEVVGHGIRGGPPAPLRFPPFLK